MENLNLVLPEIFISLSIMFLLVLGVFKKDSSKITFNISLLVLLIASVITLNETFSINRVTLFNNSVVIDPMSSLMKIITLIGAFLVLVISSAYLKSFKIFKIEYPVLILSSVLGMMVMISSNDLMVFYMGLELQSLALYVLATFNRDQLKSSEAGLKYFVLSALSSGLLLYGCSLIYGFSGSTNFNVISNQLNSNEYVLTFGIVFILVGLAFKISAVPFHMWAPDVYEGSPTSVTLFFTMVPKIAALTVFIRFLYVPFLNLIDQWQMIIIFLSIASMLFGAIAAIGQTNIKRLVAYSSIGHIGYTLAGLATGSNEGIQSSIIYISIYVIMNLALFSCLLMLKRNDQYYEDIDDLSGLSKNHPLLSLSLLVILFSLAGIPPLAGFFCKILCF
jgi:NADH-quinone oxidoreductase subunit N